MKKQIIGVVALAFILCGCSAEDQEAAETLASAAASMVAAESSTEASNTETEAETSSEDKTAMDEDDASAASSGSSAEAASAMSTGTATTAPTTGTGSVKPARDANGTGTTAAPTTALGTEQATSTNTQRPNGVYSVTVTEDYRGKIISYDYYYSFHSDGTGIANTCDGDIVPFTWDDKVVQLPKATYAYKLTGDHLRVEEPNGGADFDKKPGDDFVLNGDFSQFAGTYKATDWTIDSYGGEEKKILDLEVGLVGEISGGLTVNSPFTFPYGKPESVTKNADGSYHVVVDSYRVKDDPDLAHIDMGTTYDIYPKGVVAERDAGDPKMKDSVYIRVTYVEGGVYDPCFIMN